MKPNKDLVVLYIRLSSADGDIAEKGESNSVANQKLLLHQFLDKHPDLAHYPRLEAVDDGFSGTNGNRPMLQKVLSMAESGEVKAILVKDMSRFFRNYYETAKHLDINFPTWNVRFLSVNENYDSDVLHGNIGGIEQGLKHIINSYYPKMISKASKTAKVHMVKQGKSLAGYPIYGYERHHEDKYKIVIDPESAKIVRQIFDRALNGETTGEIARFLNDNQILTPMQYKKEQYPDNQKYAKSSSDSFWQPLQIRRILDNLTYTGALVSGKVTVAVTGSKKRIPSTPIIVEGTHEGIVSRDEFDFVQKAKKSHCNHQNKTIPLTYPLRTLVRCGHCKLAMERSPRKEFGYVYFCQKQKYTQESDCSPLYFPESEIEKIVLEKINSHILRFGGNFSQPQQLGNEKEYLKKIKLLQGKINDLKYKKRNDYEKFTANILTKEEFLGLKEKTDVLISELEQEVLISHQQEDENLSHENEGQKTIDTLTQELAQRYVKAVYVYDMNRVEVEFQVK